MRKKLLRLLRLVPIALALWGIASAQTTGTIIGVVTDASTGKPVAGALVVATSPNLQGEQTAITDESGNYRIGQLPPGPYKLVVQLQGYKPAERADIRLSADKTLRANITATPEAVQLEEQVVRTGLAPVVNVGSAETGTVVSREFITNIPVGRSFQAIAQTVPSAAADQYGVGFQGGQSAENGYIVDGLNITDPVYGAAPGTFSQRSAPTLLSNFVQEVDVKTGSFMPEYGRATGGIINVVTKGGSNEFHGSVWANVRPDSLVTPDGKVIGRDGEAIAYYGKPSEGTYNMDFGFEVGGPILKDKLWFYAGFAPIVQKTYYDRFQRLNITNADQPGCSTKGVFDQLQTPDPRCRDGNGFVMYNKVAGSDSIQNTAQTSYQWVGKLSYLIDQNNTISASTYGQPSTLTTHSFTRPQDANAGFDTALDSYDILGKYTGKFLDKTLVADVDIGYHHQAVKSENTAYQDSRPLVTFNDPNSYYGLTGFESLASGSCSDLFHCPVRGYSIGGAGFSENQQIGRIAGRGALSYLFRAAGSHTAKLGVDLEHDTFDQDKWYTGGYSFTARASAETSASGQFRATRGYGYLDGNAPTSDLAAVHPTPHITNNSYTNSFAYYLQDSWQVTDTGVTINAGIRLETQYMANATQSDTVLKVNDSWAPRVQAIWDFTGTGRGKVSASWGTFFWAIPLDMGDRAFGVEREINWRAPFSPCYPALPAGPGPGVPNRYFPGNTQVYGNFDPATLVNPATGMPACATLSPLTASGATFTPTGQGVTPVMPGLKASSTQMFGGQLEYEVVSDLSVGFEYAGRRLVNIVEDMSPDFDVTGAYFIANPGRNVTWVTDGVTYSAVNTSMTDPVTGRVVPVQFPKPERSYDGFTFKVVKNLSKNWLAQASYTYSVLRGNYNGPSMPDYSGAGGVAGQGQLDPGITAAYDLPSLVYNTKGYLPGDYPHVVKLFGSYTWPVSSGFSITGGAGYTGQSGRPNTALGAHELYGTGLAYIIQQGMAGRTPWTNQLDIRGALSWVFSAPYELRFSVDVFNILNQQAVLLYDQNYTFDQTQIIQRPGCKGQFVGTSDPVGAIQSACPDIKYLKTPDGRIAGVNQNWGKPTPSVYAFQTPIQIRFGLALAF